MGFLEAGKSSSPVVRDASLDTGNPRTIYLFNLSRGRILEYRKDIVEQKLRELSDNESSMVQNMESAFHQARAGFTPRGIRRTVSVRPPKSQPEPEYPENDAGEPWPIPEEEMPISAEQLD
jgi:hypothetical protein